MTELQTARGIVPEFHTGDRMKKALGVAEMSVEEMAIYLGVHRDSLTRWMHGKTQPKKATLRLWAMRTGVDLEWLETGLVRHQGLEPRTRWLTACDLELVA